MESKQFDEIVTARCEKIKTVLMSKAKEYASDNDRLHNFKRAGAIQEMSPAEALIGMFTKHLVSILDMVSTMDKKDYLYAQWDEKIGDAINYLILLEALVLEKKGGHDGI